MEELLHNAKEEIKRADHLIFVSLKYTRTVDMFRQIIRRMANSLEFTIDALLKEAKQKKEINEIPSSPAMKGEAVNKLFEGDEKIKEIVDVYLFFRKIIREKTYTRSKEYRRHVAMTLNINNEEIEINIDKIHEYFDRIRECISHAEKRILGKDE